MNDVELEAARRRAEHEVLRANQAAQFRSDPILQEALTFRKADLFAQFCSSGVDDVELREQIWRQYLESQAFEDYLNGVISDGAVGQEDLNTFKE